MRCVKKYLGVFATHPIQYSVPLWRKLAARDDVRVHVWYANDFSLRPTVDREFGIPVKWDVPLLEGYPSSFMKNVARKPGTAHGFWCVNCPEIAGIIRDEPLDAILIAGYSRYFEWQVLRAARRKRIPVMLRGDSREGAGVRKRWLFETTRWCILRYLVYDRMAIGLAVGQYMRRHFARHGLADSQIVMSPHCIDDDLFEGQRRTFGPMRDQIRDELGIPRDAFVVLFCAKFVPVKQPLLLPEAMSHMRNRKQAWAIVVGEGEMRPQIEGAYRSAIGDRAKLVGFINQSRLGRYYAASDVFAMTSHKETWGLVINEAMIMGTPVVMSNKLGCREDLLVEGKTAISFPFDQPAALAAVLDRLMENPELRAQLSAGAREHIRMYSPDAAVEGIVEGMRRACKGPWPAGTPSPARRALPEGASA